ncbi:Gfo/Idh/MocA family protein [Streptomyces lasiicapitis]|uniref:Gfo/Idh/MocA family protein n=1 Tax=Streptomyces lasiicapitis TaxID=1923961 RepID=UPI0036C4BFBE
MSVRKKAVVIGLGHQALEDHLPGLADSQFTQLAAVCDTDPSKVAAQAQQHNVPGFTDIHTLLEDVHPDFAIVAVPHHAGREVIATCAAAGVHVMKEKPFATCPAEAAELVALCDKAGIDLLIWYLGLPDRILSDTSTAAHPDADYDAEDTALVHLAYDSGLYGSLLISRSAGPKTEQLTMTGPRGAVVIERGRVRRLAPDGQLIESLTREPAWPSAATPQIDCFCRVLDGERTNPCGPSTHMAHAAFLAAAYTSQHSRTPADPKEYLL